MKVKISRDRMGCLTLRPVSQAIGDRLTKYLAGQGVENPDPSVFMQLSDDVGAFCSNLSPDHARDLDQGWDVVVNMEAWDYGAYVGYDAADNCSNWSRRPRAVRKDLPLLKRYRSKSDRIKVELYDTGRTDHRGVPEVHYRIFDYSYRKGSPAIEGSDYHPAPHWDLSGLIPIADILQFVVAIDSWTDPDVLAWIRARGEYISLIGSDLEERARKREGK